MVAKVFQKHLRTYSYRYSSGILYILCMYKHRIPILRFSLKRENPPNVDKIRKKN
jgi:hypothetical protein